MGRSRVVTIVLCCVAYVAAQTHQPMTQIQLMTEYKSETLLKLNIEEVRKVLREGYPVGREYNVRVRLADHQSILGITSWGLTTGSDRGDDVEQIHYSAKALSIDQTEIDFVANLTDVDGIVVTAMNASDILAFGTGKLNKTDMESRLAWLGGEYDRSSSSLRVHPGKMSKVKIGKESCKVEDAPCYYLAVSLPDHIPRCVDVPQEKTRSSVLQCDDIISLFQEGAGSPVITVAEGNMTINVKFSVPPARIEIAVFDPKDSTQLFSPAGYHCPVIRTPRQDLEDTQGWSSCRISLKDTKDRHRLMVLVVALDSEGYVFESRLEVFDDTPPKSDNVGVIVGSVVGGICGLAIIVAIVVYFIKDREDKKAKGKKREAEVASSRSTAAYQPAATSDPAPTTTTTTQSQQHQQEEA